MSNKKGEWEEMMDAWREGDGGRDGQRQGEQVRFFKSAGFLFLFLFLT